MLLNKLIRFRYLILFAAFTLWMVFFDSNNVFYRISVSNDISELEHSCNLYRNQIKELTRQRTEVLGNLVNLEKFAREKYLMKKDNEDLFIIVDEEPVKE